MREMTDVIFFAVPSSSLLAVRKPLRGEQRADVVEADEPVAGFVFWFSYSSTLMRKAASVAASSRVRLTRVFNERMFVSASVTGDAYMIRYFVLSTSLSMSLFNDRSTASRYWHALSYRLPSM